LPRKRFSGSEYAAGPGNEHEEMDEIARYG
jgi:hypothetical protein